MFSKLIILILLALTLGLYLKIVMLDQPATVDRAQPHGNVQVVEDRGTTGPVSGLKAVPEDQMRLIRQTLAPEFEED